MTFSTVPPQWRSCNFWAPGKHSLHSRITVLIHNSRHFGPPLPFWAPGHCRGCRWLVTRLCPRLVSGINSRFLSDNLAPVCLSLTSYACRLVFLHRLPTRSSTSCRQRTLHTNHSHRRQLPPAGLTSRDFRSYRFCQRKHRTIRGF